MNPPSVCVIIAAYNSALTIERAIRSALAEKEVAEIVVVDDGSNDKTTDTARACDDGSGRLKILVQSKNRGPSAARNRAIAESTAPWLTILDADDFFLPGRIKGLLAYSDKMDFVADDMFQVSEHDIDGPKKRLLGDALNKPRTVNFEEFVLSNVTGKGTDRKELGFIKPLMRRKFLEQHHIRYPEHMRLGEDFELYARALALGAKLILVPAQGYVSVVRTASLSNTHSEIDLFHLRDCGSKLQREVSLTAKEQKALRHHYLSVDCRLQWRLLINAVKRRDAKAIVATFSRPYPVPVYLLEQLAKQAYIRTFR